MKINEKGFALVLSLVLLLVMSLMGGSLIVITSSDHQSNNNSDQYQQAFYVAETGLMQGEKWVDTGSMGEYQTGESNQTFLSTIRINPSIIPKVGNAEAFYQQSNASNPFKFTPNASTIWGYNVGIEVSSGIMLMYQTKTTYTVDPDNFDAFKPVRSVQVETQFIF